jgi:hypothetical protein
MKMYKILSIGLLLTTSAVHAATITINNASDFDVLYALTYPAPANNSKGQSVCTPGAGSGAGYVDKKTKQSVTLTNGCPLQSSQVFGHFTIYMVDDKTRKNARPTVLATQLGLGRPVAGVTQIGDQNMQCGDGVTINISGTDSKSAAITKTK